MAKRRGNPNWGKPDLMVLPASPSDFEQLVKALRLSPDQYQHSQILREWVEKNKNQKYVPLDLLDAFGLDVISEV
jgi:hypothetical protein